MEGGGSPIRKIVEFLMAIRVRDSMYSAQT